jgi:ABC-2 type transport system ATP-binding protein
MDSALALHSVNKRFGDIVAIEDLDLTIPAGSTYGLIGPSGAGKTTTIRIIMSILFPDSGSVSVLGHGSALEAKNRIGYLPEERGVYRKMRVGTFISYIGALKGTSARDIRTRMSAMLNRLGLQNVLGKKCEELSKGMLQRVQFVASIINRPDLIILDEPFSGLDPLSVRLLKEVIAEEQQRGATIIFSTHVMAHAEELCKQVVMINKGRKVLDEPVQGLRRYDFRRVRIEPLNPNANVMDLRILPGVDAIQRYESAYEVALSTDANSNEVLARLANSLPLTRIEFVQLNLEDIFIRLVMGSATADTSNQALRSHLQGGEGFGA